MRFKRRKSPFGRAKIPNVDAGGQDFCLTPEMMEHVNLTPTLNMALAHAAKDVAHSDVDRVEFHLILHSWGNWMPFAVQGTPEDMSLGDPIPSDLAVIMLFGEKPGRSPCMLCGKLAKDAGSIGRWHRNCLARAYARDALVFGNDQQRAWAESIFAELGWGAVRPYVPGPQPSSLRWIQ